MAGSTPRPETLAPPRVADPELVVPLLYSVRDAGRLLAYSPYTINRLIDAGELPAVGLGRMRRIPRDAILAYIERNRVEVP